MTEEPILRVVFFRTESGREPVREWLKSLPKNDRKIIGEDIKLVQYRWPLGMPLVRKLESDLWEIRVRLSSSRIARIFFSVYKGEMVLLHGFFKKTPKTPKQDLKLAQQRKNLWLSKWKT
ncbi:MAG: type II toxin-antitoxin system RelE/ParE family toxin [Chloroflexi bacterium]|nr:type II toxin-antitoxin system RelE/ParE family toxin [Chloroflexota bacterium]